MTNRIREFRNKKGLSQSQFVKTFNEYLESKKIKSITIPTFSRWENSVNSPTETMWKYLSEVMNVPVLMLKGAYSKKEIMVLLKNHYKRDRWQHGKNYPDICYRVSVEVDKIIIYKNILPHDSEINILDNNEFDNLDFWNKNFSFIFDNLAIKWLINNPMNATEKEVLDAILDALKLETTKVISRVNDDFGHIRRKVEDTLKSRNETNNEQINVLINVINDYVKYLNVQKEKLVLGMMSKNKDKN